MYSRYWKGADANTGSNAYREGQSSDRLQDLERFVQSVQDGLSQLATVGSIRQGGPGGTGESQRMLSSPMSTDLLSTKNLRLAMRLRLSSTATRTSPSSFETMLKLAQSSLVDNGIISSTNEEVFSLTSCPATTAEEDSAAALVHAGQPILALGESTAHSLVDAFASHICAIYPCVDMATIRGNLTHLYRLKSTSSRGATSALRLIDIEILKAVMMVGAFVKSSEPSILAQNLEQGLLWTVESICNHVLVGVEDVIMSCLMVRLLPLLHCATGSADHPASASTFFSETNARRRGEWLALVHEQLWNWASIFINHMKYVERTGPTPTSNRVIHTIRGPDCSSAASTTWTVGPAS